MAELRICSRSLHSNRFRRGSNLCTLLHRANTLTNRPPVHTNRTHTHSSLFAARRLVLTCIERFDLDGFQTSTERLENTCGAIYIHERRMWLTCMIVWLSFFLSICLPLVDLELKLQWRLLMDHHRSRFSGMESDLGKICSHQRLLSFTVEYIIADVSTDPGQLFDAQLLRNSYVETARVGGLGEVEWAVWRMSKRVKRVKMRSKRVRRNNESEKKVGEKKECEMRENKRRKQNEK